jgi:hypothetical protein
MLHITGFEDDVVTMEKTVDLLLNTHFTTTIKKYQIPMLSISDQKILADIKSRSWGNYEYPPLTRKQQILVQKIVSKYLLLLKALNWPVEELIQPIWAKPPRPEVPSTRSIEYDTEKNQFQIRQPYSKPVVNFLYAVKDRADFFPTLEYDRESNHWTLSPGEQSVALMKHLNKRSDYRLDEYTMSLLRGAQVYKVPTVVYLNGEWVFENMTSSLQELCSQLVQAEDSLVAQAFGLSSLGLTFGNSAKSVLRTWLGNDEIQILFDHAPKLDLTQVDSLANLIKAVDRWPVVSISHCWSGKYFQFCKTLEAQVGHDIVHTKNIQKVPENPAWILVNLSSQYNSIGEHHLKLYELTNQKKPVRLILVKD